MNQKIKFKGTDLGLIPEDWNVVKFRSILSQNIRHGIYKSKEYANSQGIRLLKMGEINTSDRISDQNMERVLASEDEIKRFRIYDGSIIFARTSMMTGGLGNCSIVMKHSDPIIFDGNLLCAEIDTKIAEPIFYFYYFKSKYGQNEIAKMTTGTQSRNIPGSKLMEVFVPLTTKSEQRQIAKILFDLDSKIELNKNMNKTLEEIGKTIFKHWFIDFEFPNDDGNPYKSSGGEMVYNEELGKDIPKGWRLGILEEILSLEYGKALPKKDRKDGIYPVYGSGGISGYHESYAYEKPGLIIGRAGCPGKVHLSGKNFFIIDSAFYVQSDFLFFNYYLLNMLDLSYLNTGSAVPGLNRNNAYAVEIILPIPEIILKFENLCKSLFEMFWRNEQNSYTLSQIRDLLLPLLISGKIRIQSR